MPESTAPENYRLLRRSIGVLLALGTIAAGNRELSGSDIGKVQAAEIVSITSSENCLLSQPIPLLCQTSNTTPSTTTSIKPPLTTTTTTQPSRPPEPFPDLLQAKTGLQTATVNEVKYLGCISLKESSNKPDNYNSAGPYYGKYQFLQSTWDKFVAKIGLGSLVGVDIRKVDEAVQDYVALQFLRHSRNGEWGPNYSCKHYLTSV